MKTIRLKYILIYFGIVFSILFMTFASKYRLFDNSGEDRRFERFHRGIFVSAVEAFFEAKHRLPNTALELELFDRYFLNQVHRLDNSLFNRLIGENLRQNGTTKGYGKIYDDFDRYASQIQIKPEKNGQPDFRVIVPGCNSKLLYHFDKVQNNFFLMTCHDDELSSYANFIPDEYKKTIFAHPEKGFKITDKQTVSTNGLVYMHRHTKKIITQQMFDSEVKAGHFTKKDQDNWLIF